MKLLFDLYPCQTSSRLRGIGRYTFSLAREMTRLRCNNAMITLADSQFPESFEYLRHEFTRLLPSGSFLPYFFCPSGYDQDYKVHNIIAETLIRQTYQAHTPDLILYSNFLDDWGERSFVPLPNSNIPNTKNAVILYDLIPYLYQDQYLLPNPEYKSWYLNRINTLPSFDLIFSISEATRQDAIKYLKINPDKIINISGAVSSDFRKMLLLDEDRNRLLDRFGISRPFVLYIGGNNPRKNMEGMLKAFSHLPHDIIKSHQLVLNDVGELTAFRRKAASLGLEETDYVIVGHISDEELVALYNLCKLFIFPSLYEGFGLPVLEAMTCGAPVIAANNSSIPEIIGREDMLFDAADQMNITNKLYKSLTDNALLQDLSIYGLEHAKQFSWEITAKKAWDGIIEIQKENQNTNRSFLINAVPTPRHRIAFVSPLPPQKSGIAQYSADLLPYLNQHFDIDLFVEPGIQLSNPYLLENFDIYPWTQLIERREFYDTVIYQHGNSEFHSHMFDLEKQFPGVIVLHDFYLSNLLAYCSDKTQRYFPQELINSHGLKGFIQYYRDETASVCNNWPANWEVLKNAKELISHSNIHNDLLQKYYGRGWTPNTNVIKLLHYISPALAPEQKLLVREHLKINKNTFLICSFGLSSPYKLTGEIIKAFAQVQSSLEEDALLVFVGDISTVDYELQLSALVKKLGLEREVHFTRHIEKENYNNYLNCADVAIQLRTHSRGESSAALLDCLAYGIPTIINANGSFNDINSECVIKIPDQPGIDEIAKAMINLKKDTGLRSNLAIRARQLIAEEHDPEKIAEAYSEVIHKAILSDERRLFSSMFVVLATKDTDGQKIRQLAHHAAANFNIRNQSRLLIDVSFIAGFDYRSGIQRVVKSLIREIINNNDCSLNVALVRIQDNQLVSAYRTVETFFELKNGVMGEETNLEIGPGDTLFMLDSSWVIIDQFDLVIEKVRSMGGKIISMVYDLIPILYPEVSSPEQTKIFGHWLDKMLKYSDKMVCISQSVRDELEAYITDHKLIDSGRIDLSFFHLGSEIQLVKKESAIRREIEIFEKATNNVPVFLMVGTIEPRKGHAFVLDAFERLWADNIDYSLCLTGKIGWNVAVTEQRIRCHPEFGKRLFFIENPTDSEINVCYQKATALIMASTTEGFGLPIVEASLHQIPVIISDIPVFHEIGGDDALYFSLHSPASLVNAIKEMAELTFEERLSMAKKIPTLSWKESAEWLLKIISD